MGDPPRTAGVPLQLGTGRGVTFFELAELMAAAVGYAPKIAGDATKATASARRIADPQVARAWLANQYFLGGRHPSQHHRPAWRRLRRRASMNFSQIPNVDYYYSFLPEVGFFVEIGAFDGKTHSNTYHLAQAGWRGIYIEPIKEYYTQCLENHKNHDVTVHHLMIGDTDGTGRIFKAGEGSTACADTAAFMKKHDFPWSKGIYDDIVEEVPCKTLTHFLRDVKAPRQIDLMVIDTESYEWKVLAGLDLDHYDVTMLVVELHEQRTLWHSLDVQRENIRRVNELLISKGYEKLFYDDINSIFLKRQPPPSSYLTVS